MEKKLYLSVSRKKDGDLSDFIGDLYRYKIVDDYVVNIVSDPVLYFREEFINEVVKNGFHSILKFTIAMDDITAPSMHVDDIVRVFHKFVGALKPIEKLVIIDPYFYPKKSDIKEVSEKFLTLIAPIVDELKEIVVVSNGKNSSSVPAYADKIKVANKNLKLSNVISNIFHDRFWLNFDLNKGIVVGTSVNGIGKKISLVDKLSISDVQKIMSELKLVISKNT